MNDGEPLLGASVALLLGAGASREAGCPLMAGLIESFEARLSAEPDPKVRVAYDWLFQRLRSDRPSELVDVETVLTAISSLESLEEDPLRPFVVQWAKERRTFKDVFPRLRLLLHEHIRAECEKVATTDYLNPLLSWTDGPLDVFTVNYDTAIEQLCHRHGVTCRDGFGTYWDPREFDSATSGIRLFKLHGSLLWYRTAQSPERLVKIPVSGLESSDGKVTFYADRDVSTLLIFPARTKAEHTDPYAHLAHRFRTALDTDDVLVVIGYSFRDAYLKELIIERIRRRPNFRMIFVDKRGGETLSQSDRLLPSPMTFASVGSQIQVVQAAASEALRPGALPRMISDGTRGREFVLRANQADTVGQTSLALSEAGNAIQTLMQGGDVAMVARLVCADRAGGPWIRAASDSPKDVASDLLVALLTASAADEAVARAGAQALTEAVRRAGNGACISKDGKHLIRVGGEAPPNDTRNSAWYRLRAEKVSMLQTELSKLWATYAWQAREVATMSVHELHEDLAALCSYFSSGFAQGLCREPVMTSQGLPGGEAAVPNAWPAFADLLNRRLFASSEMCASANAALRGRRNTS
jgi:hypothetical protein